LNGKSEEKTDENPRKKMNIPEILNERYGKSHLSYSSLKVALSDMAKFDQYMKGELKLESPALTFGTLYDMLLFEREKAMDTYFVLSRDKILGWCSEKTQGMKKPWMTTEYKEVESQMTEEAKEKGRIMCSPEDWKMANDMIDRLYACGLIDEYLSSKQYQVEFNEMLGPVQVKGFLDCLGDGFIVDSKSTKAVDKFRYSVRDFCYDIQAYIYTSVFKVDKFFWLVQEKTYPYLPAIVECSDETLFSGQMKFNDAVERITTFLEDNKAPEQDYVRFKV
jgi:hypothetical protein